MKSVDLNANWTVAVGDRRYSCDLPHDVTAHAVRDYACAFGELNGYVPSASAVFTRDLPRTEGEALLVVSGACGYGDIYVNDNKIGTLRGYAPVTFYLGNALAGNRNSVRIELFTSPAMSDKYLGLGIGGAVTLVEADGVVDIDYKSMFVRTVSVGGRTYADVTLDICNYTREPQKLAVECLALNARGKRAGKKQRKVFVRAGMTKTVCVRVRINNPYEWSPSDPYTYTMTARLILQGDEKPRTEKTAFGVVSRTLSQIRGLYVNNRKTKLFGAYLSHADAAIGGASVYANERRRLCALKAVGYNAVHYVGCPTEAALCACDDVGMYAFVDLCAHLDSPKTALGGLLDESLYVSDAVKAMRNHPSVTLYGVADDVAEAYGRNGGHAVIYDIAQEIRALDDTRPITVSSRELVPTATELENAGCKKHVFDSDGAAINAGREKRLYETLTCGAFDCVDVCGLNYLYPLYENDRGGKRDKLIVGARTSCERAFESIDATEKIERVIGDFNDCGIDYPGGGKLNEILCTSGDIDATCCEKPQAVYKRILLNERNIAYIVTLDPETGEPVHLWNWPRHLGQKVAVNVYTSGDVVALYRDGRLVGRKLAGKINRHIASFNIDYYPGTLEAVAYFRGIECARATLSSAGTPKTLRLAAFEKNLSVSRGDLGFVGIEVCDKDGALVPYAMRTLNATVTGGELVAFINADPMLRKSDFDSCPAYNGRALAVIRPDPAEVKTTVKITGDGLLASRVSFKIKN